MSVPIIRRSPKTVIVGGGPLPSGTPPPPPPWTPADLPSIALWLRADLGVTLGVGSGVAAWADQSGNGRDYAQATAGNQSTTGSTLAGQPAITFDGIAQFLRGPSLSALTEGHVFFVMQRDADPPSTGIGFCRFGSGGPDYVPYSDAFIYDGTASTTRHDGIPRASAGLTAPSVYEVVSTSAKWLDRVDGTELYSTLTNTVGWDAGASLIGGTNTNALSAPSDFYAGKFSEIIVCGAEVPAPDLALLYAYLDNLYGVP